MARFSELTRFTLFVLVLSSVSSSSIPNDAGVDNDENFVVPIDTDAETGNAPPAVLPSVTDSEIDPNCDCQDEEALCHKFVRKLIDTNVLKGKEEFLREFRIKKICGSDGKSYSTMCQFQCARMNLGDPAGIYYYWMLIATTSTFNLLSSLFIYFFECFLRITPSQPR